MTAAGSVPGPDGGAAPSPLPADLSVVIPVYNSAEILPKLVERLERDLLPRFRRFEVVFVNDASRDGAFEVIERLAATRPWIRGFDLLRNFGQHNALLCGIRAARHGVIVTMDDDLQHPPEVVPELLAALRPGTDVVYGVPAEEQHGILRDIASVATKVAMGLAFGDRSVRNVSAFRAFRGELREGFAGYDGPYVSIDVLLSWSTNRFAAVKVRHEPRAAGVSNYTFAKLVRHAFNMLTGFSLLPLRAAVYLGFACTLLGVVLLAYVLVRYFAHGVVVQGFAFLASAISIFSGVQLFALGVIGEYVGRIHFHTMGRPTYAVRRTTGDRDPSPATHGGTPPEDAAR